MKLVSSSNVIQDALTGEQYGRDFAGEVGQVNAEALVGKQYGRDIAADVRYVTTDVLLRIYPVTVIAAVSEALVSLPDDATRPGAQVYRTAEEVAQARDPMPHPALVRSWVDVPSYGQLVTSYRKLPSDWARSPTAASSVHLMSIQTTLRGAPHSPISALALSTMSVVSRGKVYVPASGVFTRTVRTLALSARIGLPLPAEVRSYTRVANAFILATGGRSALPQPGDVLSYTRAANAFALTVLSRRESGPGVTDEQVQGLFALATQQRTARIPVEQYAGKVAQLAVALRVPLAPRSAGQVAKATTLALQQRVPEEPRSPAAVAGFAQLTTVARAGSKQLSPALVGALGMIATVRRLATHPDDVGAWGSAACVQSVLAIRNVFSPSRMTDVRVSSAKIAYTMGRTVKAPIDVIDPTVGRHAYNLHQLSVQYLATETPDERMRKQRNVFNLAQLTVASDGSFPAPPTKPEASICEVAIVAQHVVVPESLWLWEPTSKIDVAALTQPVVMGDVADWIDPYVPASAAVLTNAAALVVAADPDGWLDPAAAASDAQLDMLVEGVVVGDATFPDTTLPLSDLELHRLTQHVAMRDESFPIGTRPLSTVDVFVVARVVVARDNSLVGRLATSQTLLVSAAEVVVVPDPSLNGIPSRPRGPRPSVSIAMG